MSETIQMTVIMEDEEREPQKINVTHGSDMTLMMTLLRHQLISGNFCGGRGTCKRCRVQFLQAAPFPAAQDRQAFTPDELRQGYRLACAARPGKDWIVRLDFVKPREREIVTKTIHVMDVSGKNDRISQNNISKNRYMIAVDLGTTTIAMQLVDIDTKETVDTYCAMNPQRCYGADVLSRIQAAAADRAGSVSPRLNETGGVTASGETAGAAGADVPLTRAADIMRDSVWKVLREGADRFYGKLSVLKEGASLCCMCIAGNTTMEHLLMGLSTEGLGKSPFRPVTLGLQKCFWPVEPPDGRTSITIPKVSWPGIVSTQGASLPVYITPGISAFVGGDITAGLYCLNMLPVRGLNRLPASERPGRLPACGERHGTVLFLDLGTNGEMAVTDGERMIVTATAAGPAFEGGPGKTAAGSDMIAMTAFLLKEGIIDETGLMKDPYFDEGITVTISEGQYGLSTSGPSSTGLTGSVQTPDAVFLTQQDIRNLQMAKAAVRAGVEILCRKIGNSPVTKVFLAGGFGYYLNVDAAAAIGLLPETLRPCTEAVGNTSLAGAFWMGKDLWTGSLTEETLSEMTRGIEHINLAEQAEFEELYIRCMALKNEEADAVSD